MDNIKTIDNQKQDAINNVLKRYQKIMRRMTKKEYEELMDEIYETTRVTIDNLTSDDL